MYLIPTNLVDGVRKSVKISDLKIKTKHGIDSFRVWVIGEESDAASELNISPGPVIDPVTIDWKHYYAIDIIDTIANNIAYAKQMGHKYIAIHGGTTYLDYINNPDCAGLKFYMNNVMVERTVFSGYPGFPTGYYPLLINVNPPASGGHTYSQAQKDWYSSHMVWGYNNKAWPFNFATGYHSPSKDINAFTVVWDFQQQAVIDEVVEKAITVCQSYQNLSLPFTFAGYIIDTPRLQGPFFFLNPTTLNVSVATIKDWTGTNSGLLHSGITHEYSTYEDGMAAFYKKMNIRMREEFPNNNTKWIIDPYSIYHTAPQFFSEWVFSIKDRIDKAELIPDMLTQEGHVSDFVDNPLNFTTPGVNITKDMVGCSQSSAVEESVNRLIAAKAGTNGAWYNWFLMFGSAGTMPKFQSIAAVYPRLKLVRCIANWDNLNNIALSNRSWNGSVYVSLTLNATSMLLEKWSYMDANVYYSRHPDNNLKLYAVFINKNTPIPVPTGFTVSTVKKVTGLFQEDVDGIADVDILGESSGVWTSVVAPGNHTWRSVAYNNGIYVAVSTDGSIMRSTDKGITWLLQTSPATNSWLSVCFGANLFVAVANTGTGNRIMTSPDGITWTLRANPEDNSWSSVVYGNGIFVAVAGTGTNRVMRSIAGINPAGVDWTVASAANAYSWTSVAYGAGLFVAIAFDVHSKMVMTSPDGVTWTERTTPVAEYKNWQDICYGANGFVVVGVSGTTGERVMTSPDGITWTLRTSANNDLSNWQSVTFGAGIYVAVANNTGTQNKLMTSPDGITWTAKVYPEENSWRDVVYGAEFIAIAGTGTNRVMRSADANTGMISLKADPPDSNGRGYVFTLQAI